MNTKKTKNDLEKKLCALVKKEGVRIFEKEKMISVSFKRNKISKNSLELRNLFGYSIQVELF